MKVLIAVGGGGHFSPALAVLEQMPKSWEILLIGRKYTFEGDSVHSFEYQTAKRLGIPFETLTTGRLQRKFTKHTIPSLLKVPVGLAQAYSILDKFYPDVVLSFGGYVTVPVVIASKFKKIPIVIHEQTLSAGIANKIVSRYVSTICVSWSQSKEYFPIQKTKLTGNPLRKEFLQNVENTIKVKKINDPTLYITGGSGGSHGLNILVEGCLGKLLEKYIIIHQTGDAKQFGDFLRLDKIRSKLPQRLQNRYTVKKFLTSEEVLKNLNDAALVISRSGINTVTELLYLGKPCLLIPLPYGQKNEQHENAQFVKNLGLGEELDQLTTTPEIFEQKITEMMVNLVKYTKNKDEARKLIHTDAAEKIIKEVIHAEEKRITA